VRGATLGPIAQATGRASALEDFEDLGQGAGG
jgi:hypothetical protein